MTEASPYILEEIQQNLESAYSKLIQYLRKSSRAISAKKDLEGYEKKLGAVLGVFERTLKEYPNDEELKKIFERFSSFYIVRRSEAIQEQKETVSNLLRDLKSMVHWRKMETSYGRTLGFSDFRSLRGESKKR